LSLGGKQGMVFQQTREHFVLGKTEVSKCCLCVSLCCTCWGDK